MSIKKWLGMPAGVALIYAFLANAWIALSDFVLLFVVDSPEKLVGLSMTKGFVFVGITAAILFVLLASWQKKQALSPNIEAPLRHSRGLLVSFIVIALLVPLVSGGLIWKQSPLVEQETRHKLLTVAQLQAEQIENWLAEREGDALTLQQDSFFVPALQRWILSPREFALAGPIEELLTLRLQAYGYEAIEIYQAQRLVKKIGQVERRAHLQVRDLIDKALQSQKIQRSELYFDQWGGLNLDWALPLPSEDMRQGIVIVLHADPNRVFAKTLEPWPGAPEGALSYLISQSDFGAPTLYGLTTVDRGTVINPIECVDRGWILQGEQSLVDGLLAQNCAGEESLFARVAINGTPWSIATQVTTVQALAPLSQLVLWVTILSSLAVFALSMLLWMLWRQELRSHRHEVAIKTAEKDALLDYISHYDRITSLPNRVLFMSRLSQQIKVAKRENKKLALLLFDLDRFKDINDSYGHKIGDELLAKLAQRLAKDLRQMDTLARIGGDEFALLIEDFTDANSAGHLAQKISENINQPILLSQGSQVRVGVTMGISLFPDHGLTADALLQNADAALYRAKSDGRGGFAFYNDELTLMARQRVQQELRLKQAIFKQHLRVFYQPQVDVRTNQIVGAEALIRWLDPEQGLISPVNFIPMAAETGLIQEIGEWVLREVCKQGQQWVEQGYPPLRLAVNLSAQQFRHGHVDELVKTVLAETGFPARYLELELTESALMQEGTSIEDDLRKLRKLGVTLALDDFGTGYSSLAYLKRFALDVIKIDKSFIHDLSHLQNGQQIVHAIITMGHALGLCVLAEGVENTDQLAYLMQHDCDLYQGFLVSQALPADDFLMLFKQSINAG